MHEKYNIVYKETSPSQYLWMISSLVNLLCPRGLPRKRSWDSLRSKLEVRGYTGEGIRARSASSPSRLWMPRSTATSLSCFWTLYPGSAEFLNSVTPSWSPAPREVRFLYKSSLNLKLCSFMDFCLSSSSSLLLRSSEWDSFNTPSLLSIYLSK